MPGLESRNTEWEVFFGDIQHKNASIFTGKDNICYLLLIICERKLVGKIFNFFTVVVAGY